MKRVLALCIIAVFALAACGGDGSSTSTDNTTSTTISDPTPTVESVSDAAESQTVAYNGADWTHIPLTNAVTGETFTLADFAGKAVFVHPMATWCTNCRASQRNIRDNVIEDIDPSQIAFVSLSVETNIGASDLSNYAAENEFGWTFAVLTPEALSALVQQFGPSISNPPVQPHFIISPDGTATNLMTGSDSARTIIDNLNAARGA